jgi:predicted transcriptional regulator of viral defense system
MPTQAEAVLNMAKKVGVLRAKDVTAKGIADAVLGRLVAEQRLERVGRGLYVLPEAADVSEHHSLVEAARRAPRGVVCLLSALRFHQLTTQAPFEVWVAIDFKARAPKVDTPPLRIIRSSGAALAGGVEHHQLEGVNVAIYSAPKTVADCFKFRNKIGLDVAIEALRDYLRARSRSLDELWRFAKICRVEKVIRPYVEAMV